jgi:type I restriction enzyme S subunit
MTSTWIKRTIDDICVFRGGGTPSKSKESYWKGDIPWVSPKDMKSDVITDSIDHISAAAIKESTTNLIPAGSILVVVRSGILARTIPVAITGRDVTINQDIKALCPDSTVDAWFLFYFLKSRLEEMLGLASRGATVHRIMADQIRLMDIPVPPRSEQQRIVGILDEAFEGIATAKANAEKNLQNARALFESHLQSVFTDLRDSYPSETLKSLCERITKGSSPKWQGIEYVNSPGVLFVTSENVRENRVVIDPPKYVEDKFNLKERRSILEPGDVLTNLVGASIGRTAVYDREPGANINQAVGLIRCVPDRLCNFYLMYFLNSPVMKDFLHANEVNNARANISLTFVSELNIPLPSLGFQTELVARIREMENETQRLASIYERKLAALDDLKKSLLHQAFSGNL